MGSLPARDRRIVASCRQPLNILYKPRILKKQKNYRHDAGWQTLPHIGEILLKNFCG